MARLSGPNAFDPMKRHLFFLAAAAVLVLMNPTSSPAAEKSATDSTQLATFGGGCFWCIEAVFERVPGVKAAVSGYAGGTVANPTYEQVCGKRTGHAEVVQIEFDPAQVSYERLLQIFWEAHDPTTLNRQGNDEGPQYRSAIFYHDEAQHQAVLKSKAAAQATLSKPIVTEVAPLTKFWRAEDYHQDYFAKNPNQGYCAFVIKPKVTKLQKAGVIGK
jgi:peptide-methionine (S)-S-oxide reductase